MPLRDSHSTRWPAEWTDVMERWRHGAAFGGLNGRCRVHRAELLRISGPCDLAEEEALAACDELRPWMRREFGWPLAELGTIRLRKGDLDGAEEAFLAAHEHAWSPHPGLALLRLAQGDPDGAVELITEAIAHPWNMPSKERPPFGDLRLAPLLDAQAEIAAAVGDAESRRPRPTHSRRRSRTRTPAGPSTPGAALAAARAALTAGDLEPRCRRGHSAHRRVGRHRRPVRGGGVARMVLGEAHRSSGRPRRGAAGVAGRRGRRSRHSAPCGGRPRAADLVEAAVASRREPCTGRPAQPRTVFRARGDTRDRVIGELEVVVRDLKGFRYIERLLAEPGREFHVLDLVAVEQGSLPTAPPGPGAWMRSPTASAAACPSSTTRPGRPTADVWLDVDDDIEDALACNDIGRAELAQRDRDYLVAELHASRRPRRPPSHRRRDRPSGPAPASPDRSATPWLDWPSTTRRGPAPRACRHHRHLLPLRAGPGGRCRLGDLSRSAVVEQLTERLP